MLFYIHIQVAFTEQGLIQLKTQSESFPQDQPLSVDITILTENI